MKNITKRLTSLLLVVCILLVTQSIVIKFYANENTPSIPSKSEMIIELEGKGATFGTVLSDLRINSRIKYDTAKDLSPVDEIELNVYIQDIVSLQAFLNESIGIGLYFSSNSRKETSSRSYADISEQLVNNGWNTVNLKIGDFTTGVNWSGIRYIYLGFTDESSSLPSSLYNDVIEYRNVCDLIVTPKNTDGDIIIYNDGIVNSFGDSENSLVADITERFSDDFDSKDISKVDIIKVDFYIPDYSLFTEFTKQNKLEISFVSKKGIKYIREIDTFTTGTASGWYTAWFAEDMMSVTGEFDATAVTGVKVGFLGESGATLGKYYSIKFAVANIRGFVYENSETDNAYGNLLSKFDTDKISLVTSNDYTNFENVKTGDFDALKETENIEFDLYVNNAQNFRNAFLYDGDNNEINASWNLVLTSGSGTLTFKNVEKQVISNGWNHIILPVNTAENSDFDVETKFSKIAFTITGVKNTVKNAASTEVIVVDKIISTKGYGAKNELKFDKVAEVSNGKTSLLGNTFEENKLNESIAITDISNGKYIEFDIYIQNFNTFKTIIGQKGINDINIQFKSPNGSVNSGILGLISNQGWNHITVPYSKMLKSEEGTFDFSSVTGWSLVYSGTTSSKTDVLKGQKVAVANITAAKVINPKLPNDVVTVISEEGKSGIYGNSYSNTQTNSEIKLNTTKDALVANSIEFDFYVEDYESFKKMLSASSKPLYFALGTTTDKTNGVALYQFTEQVTGEGWNHIELQSLGYSATMGSTAPDLKNVYYAYLTFVDVTTTNIYSDLCFNIMNICVSLSAMDIVPEAPRTSVKISDEPLTNSWGNLYKNTVERFCVDFTNNPLDLSMVDQFEFDIYIEDYEEFKEAVKGRRINFAFSSADSKTSSRLCYDFEEQITHSGWNHIILNKLTRWSAGSNFTYGTVKWVMIFFYDGGSAENPIANTVLRVANICGRAAPVPYVTVGKDQSEVFITWFVKGYDAKGKAVLSENGIETEFEAFETSASTAEPYYYNRAKITGLKPNTKYTYRVGTEDNWSDDYPLYTKDFDDSFSFIQVSDVQLPNAKDTFSNWNTTLIRINKYFPDINFIINTGDISDSAENNSLYLTYKVPELLKGYITSVVPGNHDTNSKGFYNQHFTSPETYQPYSGKGNNECDYWYGYNNVLFISLNTNIKDSAYHQEFVEKVVKENGDNFDWKIVTCHHSLFSASYHSTESDVKSFRKNLAPLFSELGIDLVLSGHDHCYDRSYIMNGTEPVISNKTFAYNTNGGVLYISATSSSAMKFNPAVVGSEVYSAKIVQDKYGFINYDVCDAKITLTYYSSNDMSILDEFSVYKVNSTHLVDLRKALLMDDFDDAIDYTEDAEINILDLVRLKKMLVNVA